MSIQTTPFQKTIPQVSPSGNCPLSDAECRKKFREVFATKPGKPKKVSQATQV